MKTTLEKNAPLRSSAATLVSLNTETRFETLREFAGPERTTQPLLQLKANLCASYLLKLLIPTQPGEPLNFLPHYQPTPNKTGLELTELHLGNSAVPYHQEDPLNLNHPFSHKRTQNLGALIGLNLFMSSDFNQKSLGLVSSPTTGNLFFTQKLSSFWSDYFNKTAPLHLFSSDLNTTMEKSIALFCSENEDWWAATGIQSDPEEIQSTMIYEWLEVALRLYLTPDPFLQLIVETIVGDEPNAVEFNRYVLKQLNHFRQHFFSILSSAQEETWHEMIQDNGLLYYKRYLNEISTYHLYDSGQMNPLLFREVQELILHRAMLLGIPSLDDPRILSHIEYSLRRSVLIVAFNYLLQRMDSHWPQFNDNPDYFLWSVMENITDGLADPTGCFIERRGQYHCYFFLKSIEFHKNHTARFFIQDIPHAQHSAHVNQPFPRELCFLEEHEAMVDHSLLHFALQKKNPLAVNLLCSKGAKLLPHECDMMDELRAICPQHFIRPHSFFARPPLEDDANHRSPHP